MNYSDLMYEFVENGLKNDDEGLLFQELAQNEELRAEFKSLTSINNSIKNNRHIFENNSSTKAAVFSAIGLSLPSETFAAASSTSMSKFKLVGTHALTALVTVVALWYFNPFASDVIQDKSVTTIENIQDDSKNSTETVVENKSTEPIVSSSIANQEPKVKIVYVERKQSDNGINYTNNQNGDLYNYNEYELKANYSVALSSEYNHGSLENDSQNNYVLSRKNNDKSKPFVKGFSFEWKGNLDSYFNEFSYQVAENTALIDNSIGINLETNHGLMFGAEFRRERFQLQYFGYNESDLPTRYYQEPAFNSLSAYVHYNWIDYRELNLFSRVAFGANEIGPLGRFNTGIEYKLMSQLSMLVGAEYSQLQFSNLGTDYKSEKISLIYGLKYRF